MHSTPLGCGILSAPAKQHISLLVAAVGFTCLYSPVVWDVKGPRHMQEMAETCCCSCLGENRGIAPKQRRSSCLSQAISQCGPWASSHPFPSHTICMGSGEISPSCGTGGGMEGRGTAPCPPLINLLLPLALPASAPWFSGCGRTEKQAETQQVGRDARQANSFKHCHRMPS